MVIIYIAVDRTGYIIPLIISVLIHETAHIICLSAFKCRIKSVKLLLYTVGVEYNVSPSDTVRFISLLCGPLSNLIVAIISYASKNYVLFGINILLSIYNLLPVNGLDGGEILEIFLSKFLSHTIIFKVMKILTLLISTLFCVALFLFTNNFSFIILCLYLLSGLILKKTLKDTHI